MKKRSDIFYYFFLTTFQIFLFFYFIFIVFNSLTNKFVSSYINLDIYLVVLIILGVITLWLRKKKE